MPEMARARDPGSRTYLLSPIACTLHPSARLRRHYIESAARAAAAGATTAPRALLALTRLVDVEGTATEVFAFSASIVLFAASLSISTKPRGRPVARSASRHHRQHLAVLREQLPDVILACAEGKVPYVDSLIRASTPTSALPTAAPTSRRAVQTTGLSGGSGRTGGNGQPD